MTTDSISDLNVGPHAARLPCRNRPFRAGRLGDRRQGVCRDSHQHLRL